MHRIPGTNVVFIHIPKTAGQAVRKTFGMRSVVGAHSIDDPNDKKYLGDKYIRFCVVRNPLDRFVSAYRYNTLASKDKQGDGLTGIIHRNDLGGDINTYVDFLRHNFPDMRLASVHLQRQLFFIRKTKPQIILRQENLGHDIEIIRRLVPEERWEGLQTKNVAEERFDTSSLNLRMTPENEAFVLRYYKRDFDALGYKLGGSAKG